MVSRLSNLCARTRLNKPSAPTMQSESTFSPFVNVTSTRGSSLSFTSSKIALALSNFIPHRMFSGLTESNSIFRNSCLGMCTFLNECATLGKCLLLLFAAPASLVVRSFLCSTECPYSPNTFPLFFNATFASEPTPFNSNPNCFNADAPEYLCIVNPYPCLLALNSSSFSNIVNRMPRCCNATPKAMPPMPPPMIDT